MTFWQSKIQKILKKNIYFFKIIFCFSSVFFSKCVVLFVYFTMSVEYA